MIPKPTKSIKRSKPVTPISSKQKERRKARKLQWEAVMERANYRCEYCGRPAGKYNVTVHHIVMLSHGGDDSPENGVALCWHNGCLAHNRVHLLTKQNLYVRWNPTLGKPEFSQSKNFDEIQSCFSHENMIF